MANIGKNPQIGETLRAKYGENWHSEIGKKGAKRYIERQKLGIAKPKGFAAMSKEKVAAAGKKGGAVSRRGPSESK